MPDIQTPAVIDTPKRKRGGQKGNKNGVGFGRPTAFKARFADDLIKFFTVESLRKEVTETTKEYFQNGKLKRASEKWRYAPNKLPTLFRFSEKIGVIQETVLEWAKKGDELKKSKGKDEKGFVRFSEAYNRAKNMQKEFLMEVGMSGATPPASFIFVAKNITDMRDKVELDSNNKTEININNEQFDRIIKHLSKRSSN